MIKLVILIIYLASVVIAQTKYSVSFTRINRQLPVINSLTPGDSIFKWNYNAACAYKSNREKFGLLVRCQNQKGSDPYSTTQSVMAYTEIIPGWTDSSILFGSITEDSVVFYPDTPYENYGTEDPRVVYREKNGEYYLLYSAVESYSNGTVISRLALATTSNITDKNSWKRFGPIVPQVGWSKSGALLIRDDVPSSKHYLIFGDSSIVPGLQIATSTDLINWDVKPGIFLPIRKDSFDSVLVESGPMPLRLSDGNYLFIYNSAQAGHKSVKPNWDLQYNVGYLILDKDDPSTIIERSDQPILSPLLAWEVS
eukprot:TRINITY_DN2763_c0_g1_i2.p1 TRINITY_DN2763_c0_g1~~TRINITY_DN2763_c0_g1_i2.p1  ORF type:complete len:311 (+),score=54.98 TRINITY_DN2763_c0_g1_i2:63-995(+)